METRERAGLVVTVAADRAIRRVAAALVASTAIWILGCSDGKPPDTTMVPTASNRAMVADFVDLMYRQKDVRAAFMKHVASNYVQHNPNIADGRDAAIAALEPMFSRPDARFDVKHVLVDGDLAAVHLHGRTSPSDLGGAVVDLFRLADGKIVEHWDVLQPIPETSVNPHPMF